MSLPQWTWRIIRPLVFLPGAVFGLYAAATFSYYGLSGPVVFLYLVVYGSLTFALVMPVCWWLARTHEAGNRWTIGYFSVWAVALGALYLAAWIF